MGVIRKFAEECGTKGLTADETYKKLVERFPKLVDEDEETMEFVFDAYLGGFGDFCSNN